MFVFCVFHFGLLHNIYKGKKVSEEAALKHMHFCKSSHFQDCINKRKEEEEKT